MSDKKTKHNSNFWNSCPLKKEYIPSKPCEHGKPEYSSSGRVVEEPQCPWWINSEKYCFCFWRYIQDNSKQDGSMRELLQSDLAQLFGCSTTKIHFLMKEAIEEFAKLLKSQNVSLEDSETGEGFASDLDLSDLLDDFDDSSFE